MEYFINIPGPVFLLVFTVYAAIVIFIVKAYVARDYTHNYEVPEPTSLEAIDLAILKKGIKGAIIISIFNLWRLKGADITKRDKSIFLQQKEADITRFNKLESTIYNYLEKPKFYRHLFKVKSLKTIEKILQPNKQKLIDYKLAPDKKIINHHWKGIIFGIILLLGFGGTKLYFGITRDKPVVFLIFLLIISIIVLFTLIKPSKIKSSTLGRKLIKEAQLRFEWLKTANQAKDLLTDDNLLYGIAVFGISSFIGTELGDILENPAMLDQNTNSTFYSYGCGCAGCGGGCSGCGGGCGGCGGD